MNQLIKWIQEYQNTKEDYLFEIIVKKVEKIIYSHLQKISKQYKDDVYQEMLMGLYRLLQTFEIREYEENADYLNNFFLAFDEESIKEENWRQEYQYFCNEKQFIECLNKRLHYVYVDFLRRLSYEMSLEICNFDIGDDRNIEVRDKTEEYKENDYELLKNYGLSDKEITFLKNFIDEQCILTEKEVGIKLGISQQAVHKRKKKIIEKYKNKKKM
ncbi:MAG: hypothetical protein V8R15_04955 [Bacilli bacterium]